MKLDPVLRSIPEDSQDKINAWIKDQYTHPVEYTHTFDEILNWFDKNNIEFINSVPKLSLLDNQSNNFFDKKKRASFFERILSQIVMIFDSSLYDLDSVIFSNQYIGLIKDLTNKFPEKIGYYSRGRNIKELIPFMDFPLAGMGFDNPAGLVQTLWSVVK